MVAEAAHGQQTAALPAVAEQRPMSEASTRPGDESKEESPPKKVRTADTDGDEQMKQEDEIKKDVVKHAESLIAEIGRKLG